MNNKNFIKTTDKRVHDELLRCGFTYLQKEGDSWVFLNDGPLLFSSAENTVFTDKLFV